MKIEIPDYDFMEETCELITETNDIAQDLVNEFPERIKQGISWNELQDFVQERIKKIMFHSQYSSYQTAQKNNLLSIIQSFVFEQLDHLISDEPPDNDKVEPHQLKSFDDDSIDYTPNSHMKGN